MIENDSSCVRTVRDFYSSLHKEIREAGYNSGEISLLADPLYYERYLNAETRNYVIQTFLPNIAATIPYFRLEEKSRPVILDLGCGLGMQSLIFASFGAKVVGVDLREDSIALCWKRKRFFEAMLGTDLDVEFRHCDFRHAKQSDFKDKFDCLFSMSAFSYIDPLENTVKLISSILKDDASLFLYEENESFVFRSSKRKSRIPYPKTIINALAGERFSTDMFYGGCTFPYQFWRYERLVPFLRLMNNLARRNPSLAFTYILGMRRGAGSNGMD